MSCLLTDSTLSAVMASSTLMENLSGKGRWSGSLVFATVGKLPSGSSWGNKALRFEHEFVVFFNVVEWASGWLGSVLFDVLEWMSFGLGVCRGRLGSMLLVLTLFGVLDWTGFGLGVHTGGLGSMLLHESSKSTILTSLGPENIPKDGYSPTNSIRLDSKLG